MNIDKAIEQLTLLSNHPLPDLTHDERDAVKLGIEALDLLKKCRDKAEIQIYPMLPSETIGE